MRKLIVIFAAAVAGLLLAAGCASTHSTITEFDSEGNVIRTTETSESVIKTVTASTQGKSVIAWEDGWLGRLHFRQQRHGRRSDAAR